MAPSPREENQQDPSSESDETTKLLFFREEEGNNNGFTYDSTTSSPTTTIPLATSFEDVRESVTLLQLHAANSGRGKGKKTSTAKQTSVRFSMELRRNQVTFLFLFVCAISVTLISFPVLTRFGGRKQQNHPIEKLKQDFCTPFSTNHPVRDMNTYQFVRPDATSPSKIIFRHHTSSSSSSEGRNHHMSVTNWNLTSQADTTSEEVKEQRSSTGAAYPTNAWYQNMLLPPTGGDDFEPSNLNRIYSTPYVLDPVGSIPGIRLHANYLVSTSRVIQLSYNEEFGLTLGASEKVSPFDVKNDDDSSHQDVSHRYSVVSTTELGLTAKWDWLDMSSTIVRGMPYITMSYEKSVATTDDGRIIVPTIAMGIPMRMSSTDGKTGGMHQQILVDGTTHTSLECHRAGSSISSGGKSESVSFVNVEKDIEWHSEESDFTWILFVSRPVQIQCALSKEGHQTLQVVPPDANSGEADGEADCGSGKEETPLVVRVALLNPCTSNTVNLDTYCHSERGSHVPMGGSSNDYGAVLRRHANMYPGRQSFINFVVDEDDLDVAHLTFDWDAQAMVDPLASNSAGERTDLGESVIRSEAIVPDSTSLTSSKSVPAPPDHPGLLMFALPHHLDKLTAQSLPDKKNVICLRSLIGPTCLVEGSTWTLEEKLPSVGFRAPRHPKPKYLLPIVKALEKDIDYDLPDFFQRGAGDTYFSGKMLARLARILVVADEIDEICSSHKAGKSNSPSTSTSSQPVSSFATACGQVTLPSAQSRSKALDRLRRGVQVWIDGTAETPFVYDSAWGGVVSCGCHFDGSKCLNSLPDCPAFFDQGLNFGNGFYNDHHFHYGYHIYAAAVVAHFDAEWGRKHWEQVLLLVRDIANPSRQDTAFPLYRHKDWYQGSSWASGVVLPPYLNGKNQESSSEAIAAYEAVALYGKTMASVWESANNLEMKKVANDVHRVGLMMASTELRSANRYWHILKNDESRLVFPKVYEASVVGILWSMMAQFGTWFGPAPFLPYGIQLLPLTTISEERDNIEWVNEIYYPFSRACSDNFDCVTSGWVVLVLSTLATAGHADLAASRVEELPDDTYESAGGNGHSKSNTLWYIATRPDVSNPIPLDHSGWNNEGPNRPAPSFVLSDCHAPETCTSQVLDRMAGTFSCRERISWLMTAMKKSQWEACEQVASIEFPAQCGACDPNHSTEIVEDVEHSNKLNVTNEQCPPCTQEECASELNRCPLYERTFVCSKGSSYGGCSGEPWITNGIQCNACCEMTQCHKKRDTEAKKVLSSTEVVVEKEKSSCPPCPPSVCYGTLNQCPLHSAPFLCLNGTSIGGCSVRPWSVGPSSPCSECCEVKPNC